MGGALVRRFYQDRMEVHLRHLMAVLPAGLYNQFVADYRCIAQEVRTSTIEEMQRLDANQTGRARNEGRAAGIREAVEQMLGPKLFAEAFEDA